MDVHSPDHDERKHPHSLWLQHPRVITYIYLHNIYVCHWYWPVSIFAEETTVPIWLVSNFGWVHPHILDAILTLDTFFFPNRLGTSQVPFYSKTWPTNLPTIESYAQVLYSIGYRVYSKEDYLFYFGRFNWSTNSFSHSLRFSMIFGCHPHSRGL